MVYRGEKGFIERVSRKIVVVKCAVYRGGKKLAEKVLLVNRKL